VVIVVLLGEGGEVFGAILAGDHKLYVWCCRVCFEINYWGP
jgi:hypothetical protein